MIYKTRNRQYMLYVAVLVFGVLGRAHAAEKIAMRVSDAMPSATPLGQVAAEWAASIGRQSHGDVEVIMYSGSQLFSPEQHINAVARGYIHAAYIHFSYWGRNLPEISVLSRPYSFHGKQSLLDFNRSRLRAYLENKLQEKGMKVLAWLVMGTGVAISTRDYPVIKPGDFLNLKIRGADPLVNSMLRAVGASPVTLGGAEVYQALQTGMIDGTFTTLVSTHMRRFYEVNKWVTVTPLFPSYVMITANLKWWQSLPVESRAIISQISLDTEEKALLVTEKWEAETPAQLRQKGMNVYFPDDQEIQVLKDVMDSAWVRTFLELTGEKGREVLDYQLVE